MRNFTLPPACAVAVLLAGCSSAPEPAPKKAALEPVTGQSALYKMFQVARSWAPDAEVLKLMSMHVTDEVSGPPGTATAWQGTFTSASKSQARSFTYSAVEQLPSLHKGVFAQQEESFSGPRGADQPFLIAAVKIDTEKALETARAKAVDYEKKNPGKPITFLLEKTSRFPNPAWRVIWGESVGSSNFSIFVDASIGDYLQTMH